MRVVIAEDAALLREGLTRLLEDRGHTVCAAVTDGDLLLGAVAEHKPDVAVVDIRMPPTHTDEGLRAALQLRRDFPGTGVLMFSQYIETSYSAQLLEGGAAGVGYLLKDRVANVAEFAAALERVAGGGTALDPEVVSQLFRASRQRGGLATLTPRERQVLALMAEGRSNSAIATELVVSSGAVEKHVASIFTKLGLPPDESDNRRVLAVLHYLGSPALGVALGRHRRVQSPVCPSIDSRIRSACPRCRAYSSIMCTKTHRRETRSSPSQASSGTACVSLSAACSPLLSWASTTARDRLTPSVHSARRYAPESSAALRQVHSGSAWKSTLAHGSGSGSPATTSVNQESSTQPRCLSSPPSVIDEGRSATRNCSSLNPRHFHSSVAR
jgi:DNA-binding NarL/FixJ family response regulator